MGAPESGLEAAGLATADTLLTAFRTIKAPERARHVSVLDYWLSIRGDKEFPPLHDLDPLEISDAGPNSILLELIGGGQDADVRHLGEELASEAGVQRIIDAPNPSILACIAKKLPIVAISRDFLAFEDSFTGHDGITRCWVTLLPLSSCGSWVDYVYAFVSVEPSDAKAVKAPGPEEIVAATPAEELVPQEVTVEPEDETLQNQEPASVEMAGGDPQAEKPEPGETTVVTGHIDGQEPGVKGSPGFSKLLEGFVNLTGFYGQGIKADDIVNAGPTTEEPVAGSVPDEAIDGEAIAEAEPERLVPDATAAETPSVAQPEQALEELVLEEMAEEPAAAEPAVADPELEPAPETVAPEPAPLMEGSLQSKLAEVQAKADEAREAQLRATQALHQGLSAAYDFALDAESCPEEYLRLVEAQGLKIQLRAPMAPVAKLAFNDVCDAATIRQFEAVLAWALKVELPRGALLERIEQAGGIPELLNEFARAA